VRRVPPGPTIAIRFTLSADIGAENVSAIGVTGMHAACAFSRSHRNCASNSGRTLKLISWACEVAIPLMVAIPLPQMSFRSALSGNA
jgi:hypothetical protein